MLRGRERRVEVFDALKGSISLMGSISLIISIGSISLQEKIPALWPRKTRGAFRFPLIFSPFLIKKKGNERRKG